MRDRAGDDDFAAEALQLLFVLAQARAQDFKGHAAVQDGVASHEDSAESASSKDSEQLVTAGGEEHSRPEALIAGSLGPVCQSCLRFGASELIESASWSKFSVPVGVSLLGVRSARSRPLACLARCRLAGRSSAAWLTSPAGSPSAAWDPRLDGALLAGSGLEGSWQDCLTTTGRRSAAVCRP